MIQLHNGILLRYKKQYISVGSMRWRKLEPNLQSEVSQKEKHRYSILTVYVWNSEVPGTGDYEATNKKRKFSNGIPLRMVAKV